MKKTIKKQWLAKLILCSLLTGGIYDALPAAVVNASAVVTEKNDTAKEKTAPTFAERIKKILDEYHSNSLTDIKNNDKAAIKQEPAKPEKAEVKAAILKPEVKAEYSPKFTFDWQGTPIAQSLYAVGKAANKSIVVNDKLSGNVYVSLKNVTCIQALDYLSRSFNFNYMIDDNAIIISTADLMQQSKTFHINYIDKTKVKDELTALGIEANKIYANSETGTVSVTGTPYQLQEAKKRIQVIDNPVSQCLILAQLIEINHGNDVNLGLQYSLPTYSHEAVTDSGSGTLRGNFLEKLTFSASSDAAKSLSNGKVIARPMIMLKNGEEGTAGFSEDVPVLTSTSTTASTTVTVDYKSVGTNLKITPVINEKTAEISMKIEATVSNITQWVTQGQIRAPQISKRQAVTSAHIKSGQSFVIGGLMSVKELDNLSGIPGLMDLPILGKLFSYHSVSKNYGEVYIMITPYIVTNDIDPKKLLKEMGE